jgi:2-haloacid dehalogenase
VLSVDAVERFKPAAAVYQSAAAHLRVPINDITMVAAHDWDIAGAMRSGARGAFVQRPGMVWNPLYPPPDISGLDLDEVVDQILAG